MARTRGGTPRSPQGLARSQRGSTRGTLTPQRSSTRCTSTPQWGSTHGTSTPQRSSTRGALTQQRGSTRGASIRQRGSTRGVSTPQRGTTRGTSTSQWGSTRGTSTPQRGSTRGTSTPQRSSTRGALTQQRCSTRGASIRQRGSTRGVSTPQRGTTRGTSTSQRGTTRRRRTNAARAGPNVPPSCYQPINLEERYRELHQIRYSEFIGLSRQLTDEQKDHLIAEWAQRDVSLAFDIYDRVNQNYPPVPPPDNDGPLIWCTCQHCEPMPTADENVCCGMKPANCLSRKAVVEIMILDPAVLGLAEVQFNDFLGEDPRHDNAARRHAAYRQFTFWRHGRLGAGIRRPVPSCVVLRIRREYPSPDGTYRGYLPSRVA